MFEAVTITSVEIAHLKMCYAHTRIKQPRRVACLTESLIRHGQLVPIVVVAEAHPCFVLIDGYQRVNAARRAGLDTLTARIWPGHAPDAVCQLLARDGARQFDVFEQAALLRELKITHQLNQNQIAARMGRHPSWVARRLAIIEELPQAAIEAVRTGELSCWSAARVVVPLARANSAPCPGAGGCHRKTSGGKPAVALLLAALSSGKPRPSSENGRSAASILQIAGRRRP